MLLLFLGFLLLLLLGFAIAVNVSHRFAYRMYKIPKVHYLVKLLCHKNKDLLKESCFLLPRAVILAVDDLGWKTGKDTRSSGGPSRLIVDRDPTIKDYMQLADIAKTSGSRLIGLFVMSDFDKQNLCAEPIYNRPVCQSDATEYGLNWNNPLIRRDDDAVMQYLQDNSAQIEFGLHGVRHGYYGTDWDSCSEWASRSTGASRGKQHTQLHCQLFARILRQYFPQETLPFPRFFVPPSHAFCLEDTESIDVLKRAGIRYMSSSCSGQPSMTMLTNSGQCVNGILMLDRTELGLPEHVGILKKPVHNCNAVLGAHFPNLMADKKKWVALLRSYNRDLHTVLGRNSAFTYSQWIETHCAVVTTNKNQVTIHHGFAPDWAYENNLLQGMLLKIHLHSQMHLSQFQSDNLVVMDYYEDEFDNAFLTVGDPKNENMALGKDIYHFTYKLDTKPMQIPHFIRDKETYDILNFQVTPGRIRATLQIYGKHKISLFTGYANANLEITGEKLCSTQVTVENGIVSFDLDCPEMMGKLVHLVIKER